MQPDLKELLGLTPSPWMMAPSERLAMIALCETLRPARTLELGCAQGGLTAQLSRYSDAVVTVDLDPRIYTSVQGLSNVTPWHMTTAAAADKIMSEGLHFDLVVIDAAHNRAGVREDLRCALRYATTIVLHDAYYPPSRSGMLDVLKTSNVYYDLDLVPGGMQRDGLWGGLAIVLPNVPARSSAASRWRYSSFNLLRWRSEPRRMVLTGLQEAGRVYRRTRNKIGE